MVIKWIVDLCISHNLVPITNVNACTHASTTMDAGLFLLVRFRDCTVKYNMSNRDAVFHMMVCLDVCAGA